MDKTILANKRLILLALLVLVLLAFAFYSNLQGGNTAEEAGDKGRNGPVLVTTAPVRISDVPVELEAIGNVEASETVTIQSQVEGQLRRVHFRQGDYVSKGQLLFEIDPRLQRESVSQAGALLNRSQATVQQAQSNVEKSVAQAELAEANLKRDQAQLELARAQEARYRNLLAQNFVTREQYEQMRTAMETAQAAVDASRAAVTNARAQVQADRAAVKTAQATAYADQSSLDSARIQLGFTRIYAPISGKTGPLLVNAGNMVQANTTNLVTIGRMDPIYVAFSVPEKELNTVQRAMRQGNLSVSATVRGDTPETVTGRLFFIDNNVDATSGTVRLKAEFSNAERLLWPGRFADINLRLGIQNDVVLIPASAVQRGQQGDFVYIVDNGRAKVTPVMVDRITRGNAVIRQGLRPTDIVVRDGQMKLSPDAKVKIAGGRP